MVRLTATVEDLLYWGPCGDWTEDRIREIAGDKIEWTALDVILLKGITAIEKLWIVLRPELISEPILHELACRFAEAALRNEYAAGREPDPRSWSAIEAKRAWLRGEIDDAGLGAAQKAACAAARALAAVADPNPAAWAAEAAMYAAEAATRAAAWEAAADAADAAEVELEWTAERQVQMVREILLD